MSFQTGSVDKNGLARTPDGKLYVTVAGAAGSTSPAGAPGFATVLAQSFVAASGAADTNENALATITVPANTLGANGGVRVHTFWTFTNNANNKIIRVRFGGAAGTAYIGSVLASRSSAMAVTVINNRNATNSQAGNSLGTDSSGGALSGGAIVTSSVDTTASTTIVISGQKATGTDTLTLEGYLVEVIKP